MINRTEKHANKEQGRTQHKTTGSKHYKAKQKDHRLRTVSRINDRIFFNKVSASPGFTGIGLALSCNTESDCLIPGENTGPVIPKDAIKCQPMYSAEHISY